MAGVVGEWEGGGGNWRCMQHPDTDWVAQDSVAAIIRGGAGVPFLFPIRVNAHGWPDDSKQASPHRNTGIVVVAGHCPRPNPRLARASSLAIHPQWGGHLACHSFPSWQPVRLHPFP